MKGTVFGGCCILALVWTVAWIAASVWAILDLMNGHHHEVADIIILVIAAASLLSGSVRRSV